MDYQACPRANSQIDFWNLQLKPVLQARNNAYRQWLASENKADLVKFQQARGKARQAIHNAKNTWFQQKAQMIEKEKFGMEVHKRYAARQEGTYSMQISDSL